MREEVEDAGGAAVLATVEDDGSGQRSTGAGKAEFLLEEAQVLGAVVLCCRVPWQGGDEEEMLWARLARRQCLEAEVASAGR